MPLATVEEIHGTREIFTAKPTMTLQEAAQEMAKRNIGALMVVDDNGGLIGIVSERDIVQRAVATQCNLCDTTIAAVMTRKVCVAEASEDYKTALGKMRNQNCRHLPIVADGKPTGLISIRDLLDHQLADTEFDVKMLEQYITS
jgi:CBS domain-containing protein